MSSPSDPTCHVAELPAGAAQSPVKFALHTNTPKIHQPEEKMWAVSYRDVDGIWWPNLLTLAHSRKESEALADRILGLSPFQRSRRGWRCNPYRLFFSPDWTTNKKGA